MDIRTKIKKMVSGEIDIDKYKKEYEQNLIKEQKQTLPTASSTSNNSNLFLWNRSKTASNEENILPTANTTNKLPTYFYEKNNKQEEIKDILTKGVYEVTNGAMISGGKKAFDNIVNPNKIEENDERKWFESGAFKDGYQFGDVTKTVLGTGTDLYQDLSKGVLGIGEGVIDTGAYLVGLKSQIEKDFLNSINTDNLTEEQKRKLQIRLLANQKVTEQMADFSKRNLIEESGIANRIANNSVIGMGNSLVNGKIVDQLNVTDFEKMKETQTNTDFEGKSVLGDKSDALVESAGQLAGQIGLTTVGVPWWVTSGVTAFGGGTEEAFQNDATYGEAGVYGLINAGAEILSEKISGGISFGGKTLDAGLKDVLTKQISNRTVKALTKFGFDATGEGLEEVVTQVLTRLGQKLTYAKEDEWREILSSPEAMDKWINDTIQHLTNEEARTEYGESFIGGFALGGGANTIRLGSALKNNTDYDTGLPNDTENVQTQKTIQKQDKMSQNQTSEQISNNYITEEFKQGLEKFKSGNYNQYDNIVLLNETPQWLYNKGYNYEQPIVINMDKLSTIMKEPKGSINGKNQHGITMDLIEQLPEAISNPLNVIKNPKYNNRYIIITELTDQYGDIVIVPIEMNAKGHIEGIRTDVNRLASVYGKENYDLPTNDNIDSYMEQNKDNIVYDIDTYNKRSRDVGYRLQLPSSNITTSSINNSITPSSENVKPTSYSMQNTQKNTQDRQLPKTSKNIKDAGLPITNKTQEQNIIYNLPIDDNTKTRKHYKSIIQSQYTTEEARAISKELLKSDTYVPESNNKQLERADQRIELSGADSELNSLMSRAMTGGNIKADDIAVGERLIQYYSKTGNKQKLQDAIQATAMAGTTAGQTVQAMSLLNHQTPQGQAVWLQRSVDKMNNELRKTRGEKAEQFNLTPEMVDTIVNSENNEQLQENLNKVYKELGQQVTKTTTQKIDSWRYFAMLANPRTHIRNIVGNTAMGLTQSLKNKIAGGIEGVVSKINPSIERTHTIVPVTEEAKQFAKNDIKNVADRLGLNENKYNPKTRLENNMRTFKNNVLEKTIGKSFEINNNALEAEDAWGLKSAYVRALSEYMTANKLTSENITDKQLAKARNYAVEQAQEATFHQNSSLSTLINQLSNKNKFSKFMTDAILPFKKTPINVAKSGLEYSPIGLVKSAVYDTAQLRKGNITINKYIDNVSKGLTGTGIALVGYALASAGILKASGSDDEDKEKFDQDRGSQTYSIQIGDNTYSLDWIAPSGIPLFIGAECYEIMQREEEKKSSSSDENSTYNQVIETATNILDAFTNAMNPMTEMSMLSGLSSALKSYEQGSSQVLASFGTNAVKSYVNQFIPTALGQVAKTTDEYERSTTSTKIGTLPKAVDSTKNYAMSKIPGLRQLLPVKTDIWGNELKQSDNVIIRGLENAVFPWTRKELNSTDVDRELIKVYENTGESSVLPDSINKNLTINKEKFVMTSEEYAKYKKEYGQNSYDLLNDLVNSTQYKKLSDSQKQIAIEKAYEYAKEQIKIDYAKNNNLEYEESKLSKTLNELEKSNANVSNYLEYIALTQDMDKTSGKMTVLSNSDFTDETKQLIYENNLLEKADTKYEIIKSTGLNINSYLEYKLAESNDEFSSDKKDDGTVKGKTMSGSAKNKRWNYIENIEGATATQKLILYALEYEPATNSQKQQVINYVNKLPGKTTQEKLEILSKFKGVTIYKDGTFDY